MISFSFGSEILSLSAGGNSRTAPGVKVLTVFAKEHIRFSRPFRNFHQKIQIHRDEDVQGCALRRHVAPLLGTYRLSDLHILYQICCQQVDRRNVGAKARTVVILHGSARQTIFSCAKKSRPLFYRHSQSTTGASPRMIARGGSAEARRVKAGASADSAEEMKDPPDIRQERFHS